jgi:hypothetical protein
MRGAIRGRRIGALLATLSIAVATAGSVARPASGVGPSIAQSRPADPVVVAGSLVPSLNNVPVGDIVAFRWSSGWLQLPVQVDQRKRVELNTVYGLSANATNPVNVVVYADPKTYAGAGSGVLGALDEIVVMARDMGTQTPSAFSEPAGVSHNSGVRVKADDPLTGSTAYFYLFRRSGTTLTPGAGHHNVGYTFRLLSGDYKSTYGFNTGPNPENSVVSTGSYTRHFGDRWLDDQIVLKAGTATRVDIVDRHKALFAPGNCTRSEDTFDSAEGAFIANIVGPVRAIRSYIGANSGPYTERTHLFYDRREDIITDLRVHPIPSIMDFWDYSPAASGMHYTNSRNLGGVDVDGSPDSPASGAPNWEKVDGPQGSLTHVERLNTNISGLSKTNYYYDNATTPNPVTQCTGDQFSYGASGTWVTSSIAGTDPHQGYTNFFQGRDSLFFEAPGQSVSVAQNHNRQIYNPLALTESLFKG